LRQQEDLSSISEKEREREIERGSALDAN